VKRVQFDSISGKVYFLERRWKGEPVFRRQRFREEDQAFLAASGQKHDRQNA
jgi:hypothetical protein